MPVTQELPLSILVGVGMLRRPLAVIVSLFVVCSHCL
jgi:hypothetical protein